MKRTIISYSSPIYCIQFPYIDYTPSHLDAAETSSIALQAPGDLRCDTKYHFHHCHEGMHDVWALRCLHRKKDIGEAFIIEEILLVDEDPTLLTPHSHAGSTPRRDGGYIYRLCVYTARVVRSPAIWCPQYSGRAPEAVHSPPSNASITKAWASISSHTYAFVEWCVIWGAQRPLHFLRQLLSKKWNCSPPLSVTMHESLTVLCCLNIYSAFGPHNLLLCFAWLSW
jgi:hypothetical protein